MVNIVDVVLVSLNSVLTVAGLSECDASGG